MRHEDVIRLRHMLDAAEEAVEFCRRLSEPQFAADPRTWRAVLNCIQVVGEAANHVSPSAQQQMPDLPWREIVRMRHRLVHMYFDVNLHLLWLVVQDDLPPLIQSIRDKLSTHGEGET